MVQVGKEIFAFGLVGLAFLLAGVAPVWAGIALLFAFKTAMSWEPEYGETLQVIVFWGAVLAIIGSIIGWV